MKRRIILTAVISSAIIGCFGLIWSILPVSLSATNDLPFNISFTPPDDWKVVEEGKWGIRFQVPLGLQERYTNRLWIQENDSLRVVVDFGPDDFSSFISDKLRQKTLGFKKNYSQKVLRVNGLKTLICTYEQQPHSGTQSFRRVAALIHLEKREQLGAAREPSYRVEYKSDSDLKTALQILQTVRFYNS